MRIRFLAAATLLLMSSAPAQSAPADGFATFWPTFVAAVAKDDKTALASMTQLGPDLGDDGASFVKFHAGHLGPVVRRCLVKAKPVRAVDPQGGLSYSAFCGEVIYGFSKPAGAWKLTDLGPDD
jgi:hypothetical protein